MKKALIVLLVLAASLPAQSLKKIGVIDLPAPKGQPFDNLTMDDEDHYLLSAHLGPGILYVIDVRTNTLVKAIPGVPGITGLEYVPGLHKVYTSNWGEEKIGVVDLKTMKVVKRLPTAEKPNGSAYAPPFRKVYVSDTNGRAVAIVERPVSGSRMPAQSRHGYRFRTSPRVSALRREPNPDGVRVGYP